MRNLQESNMTELGTHPPIFIPPEDYDRLLAMAESAAKRDPDIAGILMQELERASTKVPDREDGIVRMQSHVRFRDESSGRVRIIQLVYPEQADPASGRVSVMTPVGTALIGLSEGQSMEWREPSGKSKLLTVLDVWNVTEAIAY